MQVAVAETANLAAAGSAEAREVGVVMAEEQMTAAMPVVASLVIARAASAEEQMTATMPVVARMVIARAASAQLAAVRWDVASMAVSAVLVSVAMEVMA